MNDDALQDGEWFAEGNATFGDRLAGAREGAGLGQPELSRRLGVRVKTLRAWENDVSEPRANRLSMLAGILNVSIVWLLTGDGDGLNAPPPEEAMPSEAAGLLLELRQLQTESRAMAERMGRVEKRLRIMLEA